MGISSLWAKETEVEHKSVRKHSIFLCIFDPFFIKNMY